MSEDGVRFLGKTVMLAHPCINCGRPNDALAAVNGDYEPGHECVTICASCGHMAIFDEQMRLRNLNDAEMHEIAGDKRILDMQRVRLEVAKKMNRPPHPKPLWNPPPGQKLEVKS